MLEAMLEGWRGKRVLIVGDRGGLCAFLIAVLDEIGARPVCVSDRADAQTLCRALTAGRVSAAILPGEMTGRSLPERLEATLALTREMREAGVPLLLAMSDAAVYRGGGRMNEAGEIGGRTREGMEASILQTALLGAARGLLGDAVRTMLVRHAPILGEDCAAWCDALLEGRTIRVRHPAARGVFVHPLDVVCCGLTLGARAFRCGEGGVYNIGTDERSVCTRQSAAAGNAPRRRGHGAGRNGGRRASGAAFGWKRGAAALRRGLPAGRGSGAGSALRAAPRGAGGAGGGGHPPDDADISGRLPRII